MCEAGLAGLAKIILEESTPTLNTLFISPYKTERYYTQCLLMKSNFLARLSYVDETKPAARKKRIYYW